jgi:hypothetical protein
MSGRATEVGRPDQSGVTELSHADPEGGPGEPGAALIAPFAIARVASLPHDDLIALAPARTGAWVGRLAEAANEMERLRPDLESQLYAAVPGLDAPARAAILRLRRAVHRADLLVEDHHPGDDLVDLLAEECRGTVRQWFEARRLALICRRHAHDSLREEVTGHIRPRLLRMATEETFLRPLALASPTLSAAIRRGGLSGASGPRATKVERKVLAYLIRAAAKTSPFSTFLHHAVVRLDRSPSGGLPRLDPNDRYSRSYLSRGAIVALYRAAFGCCGCADHATFAVNSSIRWPAEDLAEVLQSSPVSVGTRLWRSDRIVRIRFHPRIAACLRALPPEFAWDDLCGVLLAHGLDPEAARRFAMRLLEADVIRLGPVTDGTDEHPECRHEEKLRACASTAARSLRAALRRMVRRASAFSEAGADDRSELLRQTRHLFDAAWRRLSPSPPPGRLNMIAEDGYFVRPDCALGGPWVMHLERVPAALRPLAHLRGPYLRLRELFLERFGAGGRCHDVIAFLRDASERCPAGALAARAHGPDEPGIPTGLRVAVTAMLQFAAGRDAPGGLWVVVNQVHPGCGWPAARHAAGEGVVHQRLRDSLREWLRLANQPREPVDLVVCGECNDLQAHPRLTDRVLAWPSEPRRDGPVLDVRDLVLAHDPPTGLLTVMDADGRAVAPVYLGGTLPSPSWGPKYWLTVIAAPCRLVGPMDECRTPNDPGQDLEFRSRRSVGAVLLSRATWCVRGDYLRRAWFSREGIDRLLDVASHRREHGIPRWVYARALDAPTSIPGRTQHKPLWIDTENPFCLDLLEHALSTCRWLAIAEALPDAHSTPHRLNGKIHACEFSIDMII